VWEALEELRNSGKIKAIGVSVSNPTEGIELIRSAMVDVLQVEYNILHRACETELLPLAKSQNIGIIARTPLAWGLLTGKFTATTKFQETDHRSQALPANMLANGLGYVSRLESLCRELGVTMPELALRYVLSNPAVSCVIPGAKHPTQVRQNALAGASPTLPDDILDQIRRQTPGTFLAQEL
jgi:aryl-alcohol dehydrogenase-like predicted oxidoreductase